MEGWAAACSTASRAGITDSLPSTSPSQVPACPIRPRLPTRFRNLTCPKRLGDLHNARHRSNHHRMSRDEDRRNRRTGEHRGIHSQALGRQHQYLSSPRRCLSRCEIGCCGDDMQSVGGKIAGIFLWHECPQCYGNDIRSSLLGSAVMWWNNWSLWFVGQLSWLARLRVECACVLRKMAVQWLYGCGIDS